MTRVVALNAIWNEELAEHLDPAIEFRGLSRTDGARCDAALGQADILISAVFDRRMARAARRLRLLICPAAGTERIDRAALPAGVRLLNAVGHESAIAEYVIAALVALRRQFRRADAALRSGRWIFGFHNAECLLDEVQGSNLGLLGFGRIGREIAPRAAAFGMRCAALTMQPEKRSGLACELAWLDRLSDPGKVDELVAWADALVLCCELSALSEGLLDERRFHLMKRNAILINVARGPIAVERDLFEALRERRIAAAALDVWYKYPRRDQQTMAPSRFPFHELDNVLMTPHCSGWTYGNKLRRLQWLARVINDFAAASLRE